MTKVRMLSGAAGRNASGEVYVLRRNDITEVSPETARAWERDRVAVPIEIESETRTAAERALRRPRKAS